MTDGVRSGAELAEDNDPAAVAEFLEAMVKLDLVDCASSPRPESEAFPQEAEMPCSAEPPAIRISEPVETLAGPSTCSLVEFACIVVQ